MKNMHLLLPEPVYARLRAEARRSRRPATDLAREAIDQWLADLQRSQMHEAVLTYADEVAGTTDDLDPEIEAAGIDHLLGTDDRGGRAR
jgi:hypothetical protein